MARILTLEEITEGHPGWPIFLQEKGAEEPMLVIYRAEHIPYFRFEVYVVGNRIVKTRQFVERETKEYRETWRCFDKRPTGKELKQPFKGPQEA